MIWSKKVGEDILVMRGSIPPSMNYMIVKEIWEWNDRKAVGAKCYKCSMVRNSFCPPCGNVNAKILFLGMCPGEVEIREGRPFSGPAGGVLDEIVE
jgi:uracil-DNA glycosylase